MKTSLMRFLVLIVCFGLTFGYANASAEVYPEIQTFGKVTEPERWANFEEHVSGLVENDMFPTSFLGDAGFELAESNNDTTGYLLLVRPNFRVMRAYSTLYVNHNALPELISLADFRKLSEEGNLTLPIDKEYLRSLSGVELAEVKIFFPQLVVDSTSIVPEQVVPEISGADYVAALLNQIEPIQAKILRLEKASRDNANISGQVAKIKAELKAELDIAIAQVQDLAKSHNNTDARLNHVAISHEKAFRSVESKINDMMFTQKQSDLRVKETEQRVAGIESSMITSVSFENLSLEFRNIILGALGLVGLVLLCLLFNYLRLRRLEKKVHVIEVELRFTEFNTSLVSPATLGQLDVGDSIEVPVVHLITRENHLVVITRKDLKTITVDGIKRRSVDGDTGIYDHVLGEVNVVKLIDNGGKKDRLCKSSTLSVVDSTAKS
jgi:hypothetical protein